MTSAPSSARIRVQVGPATNCVMSSTRYPLSIGSPVITSPIGKRPRPGSPSLELAFSEQHVPGLSRRLFAVLLAALLQDGEPALHGRPCAHRAVPALQVRPSRDVLALPLVRPQPRIDRHVGNRVFAGEV